MVERGQEFGFAIEPRQPFGVARKLRGQRLDSHVASELRVARAIHLAHSASTNFGGDVVVPDRFTNQRRAPSCAAVCTWENRRDDIQTAGVRSTRLFKLVRPAGIWCAPNPWD